MNTSRDHLLDLIGELRRSFILHFAVAHGIVDECSSPRLADEVAVAHGWDLRATQILLDATVAVGLLDLAADGYVASVDAKLWLAQGAPCSLIDMVRHERRQVPLWMDLARVARAAAPLPEQQDTSMRHDAAAARTLHRAMRQIDPHVPAAIASLRAWEGTVLDIGGGHGEVAAAIVAKHPLARAVVLDLPAAHAEASATFTESPFPDRLAFEECDLVASRPLGNRILCADGAVLSRVLHNFGVDSIRRILRSVHDALRPGGSLVVIERRWDPARTEPPEAALFGLYMRVTHHQGWLPPSSWLRDELRAVGFVNVAVSDFGPRHVAIVGTRSEVGHE